MDDTIQLVENAESTPDGENALSVKYNSSLDAVECNLSETCLDTSSDDDNNEAVAIHPHSGKKSLFSKVTYFPNLNDLNQFSLHPFIVLFLLLLIYVLNQADRLVLPVVIPSGLRCKASASSECDNSTAGNISDVNSSSEDCISFNDYEQGLITGPAFTVVYVICGLPISRIADRWSRTITLLIGLAAWSSVAFCTGFVQTFWQLLLLRIFLGIGEATCNPVAYSLISDYFSSGSRATVLSIYHIGVYIGGAIGYFCGLLNTNLNWRWTFRILGIAGVSIVPLSMVILYEPRGIRENRKQRRQGRSSYSIKEVFLCLIKSPSYWVLLVAASIRNIAGYAIGAWLPTYFVREYGVTSAEFGLPVGFVVLCGGTMGSLLGGFVTDRLKRKWRSGVAEAVVIAFSQILAVPFIAGVLLASNPSTSYGLLFMAYVTAETWLGPAASIVQDICMPAMRAQASSVYIATITIAASSGPILVPTLFDSSKEFEQCSHGVGYSLLIVVSFCYVTSAVIFLLLGLVIRWESRHKSSFTTDYTNIILEQEA